MAAIKSIIQCTFFFFMFFTTGESQNIPNQAGFKDVNNNLKTQNIFVKVKPYASNLEDSPLLFVEDQQGYLIPKSGEHTEILPLNYHVLLEHTVFRKDGEQYSIENKYLDSMILIQEGKQTAYCFKKIAENGKVKFMEILHSGRYPLYVSTEATLVQPDYNAVLMTGSQNFTIDTKKNYYIEDAGQVHPLPKKSKHILASPAFSKEFKKLVKQHNPKFRREKDISAFFDAIN